MIKYVALFIFFILQNSVLHAERVSYIFKQNDQVLMNEGDLEKRRAPCSTFKIAFALMGYNEGILIDELHPEWPFEKGYTDWLDRWKQPHTPQLFIKNSCLWFSQLIAQKLGVEKFQEYLKKFNYGNQNISGYEGENNTLTSSWISSSLEISPLEQIAFLEKLLSNQLPVSEKSHEMTRNILYVEDLIDGWKLYGKTGSGSQRSLDKKEKLNLQVGWYVGWIEKDNQRIFFAYCIEDDKKEEVYASFRARDAVKEKLQEIIKLEVK